MDQLDESKEAINQMLGRAKRGDQSALPELREFLDTHPEIWQMVGDMAAYVREALIVGFSGADLVAAESIRRKMQELKDELIGSSVSPVVRLLAEQCVLCWAQWHQAEHAVLEKNNKNIASSHEMQKRLNATQTRYDRSLKTLVSVKRMLAMTATSSGPPQLRIVS